MPGPLFEIRRSRVHGNGAFARRAIPRGRRVAEYTGERISHAEASRRYDALPDSVPTYLFAVDSRVVVDATHAGGNARYINHACQPNCEAVVLGGRVFIETIVDVPAGVELTYDYNLYVDAGKTVDRDQMRCACGSARCRGTLLGAEPTPRHARGARGLRRAR
jgi:SET domain-containing protein